MLVYLENERENSFWEVEVVESNADLLTIRQRAIGTAGKSRGHWLEAGQSLEKLVAAKKKKGYVEVSPAPPILSSRPAGVRLPGEGLREEELALFTPALIAHPSEAQRNYWRKQMGAFLRERVYRSAGRLSYIGGKRTLAEEYEIVASWASPAMEKKIARDDRGMVLEIRYSINGLVVLRLENTHTGHEGYPPIQPFFTRGLPAHYGYQYGTKRTLVEKARELLTHYPAFVAAHLPLVSRAEQKVHKAAKLRSIAEGGIAAMVDSMMLRTGYEYRLVALGKRGILQVRLDGECCIELSIPNGSFPERIGHVLPTLELVMGMWGELQMPVRYTNGARRVAWGTVLHHESNYYEWNEDPRHLFWQAQYRGYAKRMLRQLNPEKGGAHWASDLALDSVAEWAFAGLDQEVNRKKGYPSVVLSIKFVVAGRCVLHLHPTTIIFPLGGYSNEDLSKGGGPTLVLLKGFLDGLVGFYRDGEELFNSMFNDGEWIDRILAQAKPRGWEWHINLGSQSRVVLEVRHGRNGVIDMLLPKEQLGLARDIPLVVARVVAGIKASKMAFKIETLYREGGFKKG